MPLVSARLLNLVLAQTWQTGGAREVTACSSSVAEVGASRPEILLYSAYLMRRRCDGVDGGMVAALLRRCAAARRDLGRGIGEAA